MSKSEIKPEKLPKSFEKAELAASFVELQIKLTEARELLKYFFDKYDSHQINDFNPMTSILMKRRAQKFLEGEK
jgi:hypothetical protein